MGRLMIAGLVGLAAAAGAHAQDRVAVQRPGAGYPPPPASIAPTPPPAVRPAGRWGSKTDGRWWGGVNAPGGYAAYRRPVRGYVLPAYWNTPRFHVDDWRAFALPQPPVGYRWVRYYDDAVLIDGRGAVYDTEFGVDWDRLDRPPAHASAPLPPPPPVVAPARRDTGLGGAAIGAVAGGALGAAVAGRGDRLGGALIGGGVGAATGYAIDRAEDRGRVPPPPPPGYGAGYPPPPPGYAYAPPPAVQTYTVPAGGTQTVFVGPGVTTVTVTTQPAAASTTTTEYVDEVVTYTRPARPVYRTKLVRRGKLTRR